MAGLFLRNRRTLCVLACVAACLPLFARSGYGDTFDVLVNDDSGADTLRQGVLDSNAVTGPNSITFSGLPASDTIVLLTPLANISSDLTLDGTVPGNLLLMGNGTALLTVNAGQTLQLTDLRFEDGSLLLGNAANLTFNVTNGTIAIDETIGDAIGSTGGTLEKLGVGTLSLTGASTFSGGALVSEGILEVSADSLLADASIASGATLRFLQPSSDTYDRDVSGAGGFVKTGVGALTLTGTNTYTGGTIVSGGSLLGAPGAIQRNVEIESGATLQIIDDTGTTYTGTITGSGTLVKAGTSTLILVPSSGANSWAVARIALGALQGNVAAISGHVEIDTATTLILDEAGTGTLAGDLSGNGQFEKRGAGTVTLTGDNSGLTSGLAGAITLTEGRLIGETTSIPVNVLVQPTTTLIFDQSTSGTYNSVISGGGDVIKQGTGTLTVTAGQVYTGSTSINAGRLDVMGSFASDITISSGATLGGTGATAGSVANSGRVAPGTSIGTLSVGSISFAAGSILEIETDPSGAADQLIVANNADLSGGTLEFTIAAGTYVNQPSTILTAGSITGSLAFTDDFPLLDITVQTNPTAATPNVELTIAANGGSIAGVASTANQRAVGGSLDAETATAGADLTTVLDSFTTLRASEFADALDSLSGETLTQFATVRFEHADRFDLALHSRLRKASDSLELVSERTRERRRRRTRLVPAVSAKADPKNAKPREPVVGLWLEPYGVFGALGGEGGESDVDYLLFGIAVGVEATPFAGTSDVLRDIRLGAAFGYGNSRVDFDDLDGDGTADSYMGALYGGWSNTQFRVGLSGRVAYSEMESKRTIAVATLIREAEAEFDGLDIGSRLEVGGKWIESKTLVLESYGSVDYARLQRSSIRETGAASVNLRIDREKLETLRFGLGTRLRTVVQVDRELWMLPEIRGEWRHQILDRDREVDAAFAGATAGSRFKVRGARLERHAGSLGVGWTVRSRSGFEAGLEYELGIDAERLAHGVGLRIGSYW